MKLNPKNLRWRAPTENTDGTPITQPLDYELGERDAGNGVLTPKLIVVGSLQADGLYSAPLADMAFPPDVIHVVALRAIVRTNTALVSAWSETVSFSFAGTPLPPTVLAAE